MSLRALAAISFLTALAAVGVFADPSAAEEAGLDVWHVVDDERRIRAAEESNRAFDRATEESARRIAARDEVKRDLAEGRLTFAEAAARFTQINRSDPRATVYARRFYPGRTEADVAARQLVQHLRVSLDPTVRGLAPDCERALGVGD